MTSELQDYIHTAEAEIEEIQGEIDHLRAKLREKELELATKSAKLEGVQMALQATEGDAEKHSKSTHSKAHRARLGAKKRFIYEMISIGYSNEDAIKNHILSHEIDIKDRYVRDVVRGAISDSLINENAMGELALSKTGANLLQRAPLPSDWHEGYSADLEIAKARKQSPNHTETDDQYQAGDFDDEILF